MKQFLQTAFDDQLNTMGETVKIKDNIKGSVTDEFQAIVTTRSDVLEVELGTMTYNVTAHALIPQSIGQDKIQGHRLLTKQGEYIITSATKSINDVAYSCDLVKVKSI